MIKLLWATLAGYVCSDKGSAGSSSLTPCRCLQVMGMTNKTHLCMLWVRARGGLLGHLGHDYSSSNCHITTITSHHKRPSPAYSYILCKTYICVCITSFTKDNPSCWSSFPSSFSPPDQMPTECPGGVWLLPWGREARATFGHRGVLTGILIFWTKKSQIIIIKKLLALCLMGEKLYPYILMT